MLTPQARRLVKWIGYPLFGAVSFVVFFYATIPYDRLGTMIEEHIAASGEMRASIGDVSPSPLLGLTLSDVRVTVLPKVEQRPLAPSYRGLGGGAAAPAEEPPPEKPKPLTLVLDEVTVSSGLLALITGAIDVDFSVAGFGGRLEGALQAAKKTGWALDLDARGLKLQRVPQIAAAIGLPVKGDLDLELKLVVPKNRWSNASGAISVSCNECSIGDGKAKLKVPGDPLLAMGVTLPRVRLGRLRGEVNVKQGLATLSDVTAKSPDVELELDGTVRLRQPVDFSMVDAYLRFKIDPALKRRDAKFELLENGLSQARRSDGFFGMSLSGTLKNLRSRPSRVNPHEGRRSGRLGRRPAPAGAEPRAHSRLPLPGGREPRPRG